MRKGFLIFLLASFAIHIPLIALVIERPRMEKNRPLMLRFHKVEQQNLPALRQPEPQRVVRAAPPEPPQETAPQVAPVDELPGPPRTDPSPEGVPTNPTHADSAAPVPPPAILPATPPAPPIQQPIQPPPKKDIDLEALRREYFRKVIRLIDEKKEYPRIAVQRDWQGKVGVRFTLHADGSVGEVKVVAQSDYAVLDSAAIEAVKKASPFPAPPSELNPPLSLRVNIVFQLNDEMPAETSGVPPDAV
ncbi:MAG: TonB family protein [bacterium JZ-2024 1]